MRQDGLYNKLNQQKGGVELMTVRINVGLLKAAAKFVFSHTKEINHE